MKDFISAVSTIESAILQSVMASVSGANTESVGDENVPVEWNLPGFVKGARVGTSFGDLPIEALRVRDEVRTSSGVIARVQWIDKIHLDEDFVQKHPTAQPIRIRANAFGQGRPMQDLTVSPRQELCADAHVATRFQTAGNLAQKSQAHRVQTAGLTYYRFHCGDPVTVRVEGVWVRV